MLDRLFAWWRRPSSKRCEDDPDGAVGLLQEEQARIAQELEETFLAYDKKLQAMARRLAGADGVPVTKKELRKLKDEQLELWRLVRRAQASSRTTRELKRELQEWKTREPGAVGFGHPDHPETRAELVSSELRVRGAGRAPVRVDPGPSWTHDTDERLLRELWNRRREMERIMEHHPNEESVRELATFVSELRELHAHLRLHDRRNGIERERWRIGIPVSD